MHLTRSLISLLVLRSILALRQNLEATTQSNSAANNPITRTFAQHVGHAQDRTLQEILQHQDKFSSARTHSMKHVALTKIMEGGLSITGMEPQLPRLVMEKTSRLAAR